MKLMDVLVALLFLVFLAVSMGGINDHFFRFLVMAGLIAVVPSWICIKLVKKHWRVK